MPDTSEGKVTPLQPNMMQRVVQGVRYTIAGIVPETWFSPMQPLEPVAPDSVAGRLWNYTPGYNLNINPRPYEGGQGTFALLRQLSECDLVRLAIQTRKDQLDALPWSIKAKEGKKGDYTKRIDEIATFLQQPDRYHTFDQWLGKLLEDMLVIDAATIYKRRDRAGRLYALDIMDGATIAIKIDAAGRVPEPPSMAYQQILNGVPAADYTTQELVYMPRNLRNNSMYGYSPVEQIAFTINILLRRMSSQLNAYDSSNLPPGLLEFPTAMTEKQIGDFMKVLNARISGNTREQQKLFPVPSGTKYQEIKKPALIEQQVEEWLARVVCYAFSLSPQAFVKEMNRATADTAKDTALAEGLTPIMNWVKRRIDAIIAIDFGAPDLEFVFLDDKEQDPKVQMEVLTGYSSKGVLSIDTVRTRLGEDPLGGAFAEPMVLTATGYVPIYSREELEEQDEIAAERAAAIGFGRNGDESGQNNHDENAGENGNKPPKADKKEDEEKAEKLAGYTNLAKGARRKIRPLPFPARQR